AWCECAMIPQVSESLHSRAETQNVELERDDGAAAAIRLSDRDRQSGRFALHLRRIGRTSARPSLMATSTMCCLASTSAWPRAIPSASNLLSSRQRRG